MNTPKAIFFDVDGTLVSFDTHRVPSSAVEALWQVHRQGIKIIIATGRPHTDLHAIADLPYDGVAAFNGAECVLRDGTPIARQPISLDDFLTLQALARKHNFPLALDTYKGVLISTVNPDVVRLAELVAHPVPRVTDLEKEFRQEPGGYCQLCLYCDEAAEKQIMAQLPGLAASRWTPLFADINAAGVDKSVGVKAFCTYYGLDVSQTMAFGDGGNDIPMLRTAGTKIAMGGATEPVKAAADYVTDAVDNNGIKNALLHFGVIAG